MRHPWITSGIILLLVAEIFSYYCDRTPERATKPQNRVETNRYVIEISGNPRSYVPGENYTITLRSNPQLPSKNYFSEFTLVVEPENTQEGYQKPLTGSFQLKDSMLTRFSSKCPNTVKQTNSLAKTDVRVFWVAPPTKNGCLAFKATVLESSDSWFSDDGELTKILCEDNEENEDTQPPVLKRCCACKEAKYEVAFQGMWSRNTHPKDYPTDIWTTKFSDVVGASHKIFKSFWNYYGMASEGLQLLAEAGDTSTLENELKDMVKSEDIRTIIKARELTYPNITGTSYTVFRVDNKSHLISLVSKITPSPDWIVGVANLELCLRNCSWVQSRTLNLYPWDVGTDDGISYNDRSPSSPKQPIRRITTNNPNREESPFHNPEGEPIKPLARLHVTLQKEYEQICNSENPEEESNEVVDPNCATTEWTPWSLCQQVGTYCSKFRQRNYVRTGADRYCQEVITESKACQGDYCTSNQQVSEEVGENCETGEWGLWSNCSVSCGKGVKTRERALLSPDNVNACRGKVDVQGNEECEENRDEDCDPSSLKTDNCPNTLWDEWSPCNATCDSSGLQYRYRTVTSEGDDEEGQDDPDCSKYMEVVECYHRPCEENSINIPSYSNVIISSEPDGPIVDCKVSKWSIWGPCSTSEPCTKGYKVKSRYIKVHPQNGGKACPRKLQKRKKCHVACKNRSNDRISAAYSAETLPTWGQATTDCVMAAWTAWTPCSTNCGISSYQIRTRSILREPSKLGAACGARIQSRACPLPLACTDRGTLPL